MLSNIFVNVLLIVNLGLFSGPWNCVQAQENGTKWNGTAQMEVLQNTFFQIEEHFESAKSSNETRQFDTVLTEVKQLKAQLADFYIKNRAAIDEVMDTYIEQIVREIDQLGAYKIEEALNWIVGEILGFRGGFNQLVQRESSTMINIELGLKLVTFGKVKLLGQATEQLMKVQTILTRITISHNMDKMVRDSQECADELTRVYHTELAKYNFQNKKDLRIKQKYLIARFLNMFKYGADYFRAYKNDHGY